MHTRGLLCYRATEQHHCNRNGEDLRGRLYSSYTALERRTYKTLVYMRLVGVS